MLNLSSYCAVLLIIIAALKCSSAQEFDDIACISSEDCGSPHGVGICNETNGICECQLPTCFDYSSTTNSCILKKCRTLSIEDNVRIVCMNRGTKTKSLALLLNIFAFTGAANIYLKHYIQGTFQMFFLLMLIITVVSRFCVCIYDLCKKRHVYAVERSSDNYRDSKILRKMLKKIFALEILTTILVIIQVVWLVIDFYQLGINGKLDGDGCLLDDDTLTEFEDISSALLDAAEEIPE